jgi:sodium-dependent dicarboxylate transporter 2/3/5
VTAPGERTLAKVGLGIGPALFVVILFAPIPGLEGGSRRVAALMAWMLAYWVTEAIPLPATAVAGAAGAVALGLAPAREVFSAFADPLIFLFIGSFLLAQALHVHGLDRRLTGLFFSLPGMTSRPWTMTAGFAVLAAGFSMWVSNTATAAMLLPLALGIAGAVEPKGGRFTAALLLLLAYGVSVGGIGTPVGSPPNLIGLAFLARLAEVRLAFYQWMALCVPLLSVMLLCVLALLWLIHGRAMGVWKPERALALRGERGPWTPGQRNTCLAFFTAVALWLAPSFLTALWGGESEVVKAYTAHVPEGVAAILAASLLFVLPVDFRRGEFTLNWKEAAAIDWGTLLLFGGGLTLGRLMFETGLADQIGKALGMLPGAGSLWGLTAWAIALAILMSDVSSNTATASVLIPVVIALAMDLGLPPVPPALGATLGASYGFLLPVSTPPNAIVYGTGHLRIGQMVRTGAVVDVMGFVVIFFGLRVLLPLFGLSG